MKILIVDDELLVRIGIKSCVDWKKFDIEVSGEASDGIEALHQVRLHNPDVILLDIKMPNMDGIEFMKRLREIGAKSKILILSGFDDFQHVREAMKLGAVDYLHKPCMNPRDIIDSLLNIRAELENKSSGHYNPDLNMPHNIINHMTKETFLVELVSGRIAVDDSPDNRIREYGLKSCSSNISCIVFGVRDYQEIKKRYEKTDPLILSSSISNIMNEILSNEKNVDFFAYDSNTFAVITGSDDTSRKKIHEWLLSLIRLITDAMKQFLNIDVIIGVSDVHVSYREISQAFNEAYNARRQRFYDSRNVIYHSETRKNTKRSVSGLDSLVEKVKDSLSRKEYWELKTTVEELFDFLKTEGCLTGEEVKKLFCSLLFFIRQGKEYLAGMEAITCCETLSQLTDIWRKILDEKLAENMVLNKFSTNSSLVKNTLHFIEKEYSGEITLNMLSEKLNISPNYISKLFREETGENLFHYINEVRVEKAKALLKNSDMKIYEIGFRVGFKSAVHFNIVFNRLVGASPKQYREAQN